MLSLIGNKYNPNSVRLCRDDRLAVYKNTSGPQSEKIKKIFQKMLKNKGLHIIIKCNMKTVNYLDIMLNLNDGSYRPYKKPNEETNYIHVNSNHPPSILKHFPPSKNARQCNCQQKENCPMNRACLKESLVYYVTISCNNKN